MLRAANEDGATVERASDKLSDKLSRQSVRQNAPKREDMKRKMIEGKMRIIRVQFQFFRVNLKRVGGASLPVQLIRQYPSPSPLHSSCRRQFQSWRKKETKVHCLCRCRSIQPSASGTRNITAAIIPRANRRQPIVPPHKGNIRGSRGANMPKMIADFAETFCAGKTELPAQGEH